MFAVLVFRFRSSVGAPSSDDFHYSARYSDNKYEYRHVHVPKELAKKIPRNHLLSESEWRSLGVQQSVGWQ
jgi:cyclin-dependent kinase regulatory subunit CKS1